MRIPKNSRRRAVCLLLGLTLIWGLTFPYFTQNKSNNKGISVNDLMTSRQDGKMWMETNAGKYIMSKVFKFVDELLSIIKTSNDISPPPPFKDYKEDFNALQIKIEAENEKGKLKDELIKELRSDKVQLQQQVAHLEELLKLQAQTQNDKVTHVKADDEITEDVNCPFPPMDGYPSCKGKLKWMKEMWRTDPCYASFGVNDSLCSQYSYLSEIESWCPLLPGRVKATATPENAEMGSGHAVVRDSLEGLYPAMQNRSQYRWIHQRIRSMEGIWVEAGRSLSSKYNLAERKVKQILVHPGVVTDEADLKIAENAFSGGPLGELVQWSDLISTLYILGHQVHLSASKPNLRDFFEVKTSCPPHSKVKVNLIYTDIIGLRQFQVWLGTLWIKYKCIIRVLDSFGTEPDFNYAKWAKDHKLQSPFGGLDLIPKQFNTMFPHTPDNTFLGFVVQHQLSTEETEQLKSTTRQNQALVYGKRASFWKGKDIYLDVIHKYLEIHGTVDNSSLIPSYVKNHGIIKNTEVQMLLRRSKVFVGLSFPYEGPAPLEALANGCVFLNPRLHPPQSSLNSEFFKGKPNTRELTSQHPYAEAIGEPYVWLVDMHNTSDVERALTAILNQTIKPYLPYEFTCEGMLQRVNVLIEKQDFCIGSEIWPPLSVLQVLTAEAGMSCKQACQKAGLICEPAYLPHLNNVDTLLSFNIACQTSEFSSSQLVFPAYNYNNNSKHCVLQSDSMLFSCVREDQSLNRICPCRDYIKDQIALCKACT